MTSPVTRRAAIVGAIASATAVGILGARAANGVPNAGESEPPFDLQHWLDTATVDAVIDYHLTCLTIAMQQKVGGGVKGYLHQQLHIATVAPDPKVDFAYVQWDFDRVRRE